MNDIERGINGEEKKSSLLAAVALREEKRIGREQGKHVVNY